MRTVLYMRPACVPTQRFISSLPSSLLFVAASLELPKWPEISRIKGDRMTWNEVVALAETIRGTRVVKGATAGLMEVLKAKNSRSRT